MQEIKGIADTAQALLYLDWAAEDKSHENKVISILRASGTVQDESSGPLLFCHNLKTF